jgi:hypothetical protein
MIGGMSGSLGGLVASHNKGGTYLRRRSVPTDPGSTAQTQVRNALGALAQDWTAVLSPSQRAGWDTYAAGVSWVDSLGQTIQLSGINMFIRSNAPRLQADAVGADVNGGSLGRIDDAPALQELGIAPQVTADSLSHATGPPVTIGLTVDYSNDADYAATDFLLLYVSPPMNPSIKFFKGPYFLMWAEAGDEGSVLADLFSSGAVGRYESRFGPIVTGQAVHWQMRAAMADGRLSSRVRGGPVIVPAAA